MKNSKTVLLGLLLFLGASLFAQDLKQSEVPSLVLNNFNQKFPKAFDLEWEMKGELYKAEFETGFFNDHEAWYDASGNLVKYKTEISASDLPNAVQASIQRDFPNYRTSDVEKIEEGAIFTYKVELKNKDQEWDVVFNEEGEVLRKWLD